MRSSWDCVPGSHCLPGGQEEEQGQGVPERVEVLSELIRGIPHTIDCVPEMSSIT